MLIFVAFNLQGLVALIAVVTPKVKVITTVLLVKVVFIVKQVVIKLVVKLELEVGFVIFRVVVIMRVVVITKLKPIVDPLISLEWLATVQTIVVIKLILPALPV